MSQKPIVITKGQLQQLASGVELDIPLEDRFQSLQRQFRLLLFWLLDQGFDLTSELTDELELLDQVKGKQKC